MADISINEGVSTFTGQDSVSWSELVVRDWLARSFSMKSLFEAARVEEVKERMAQLRPDSERLWGKMNAAQALAHCSGAMEMAVGDRIPPRLLLGWIIGWMVKPMLLGNDEPMRRNSPTMKGLVVQDERDLRTEAVARIDRSVCGSRAGGVHHASA